MSERRYAGWTAERWRMAKAANDYSRALMAALDHVDELIRERDDTDNEREGNMALLRESLGRRDVHSVYEGIQALTRERDEARRAIEADRSRTCSALNNLLVVIPRYQWISEGRGPYEWDDDQYRAEFANAMKDILEAAQPLRKISVDLSNSPKTGEEVVRARANLERKRDEARAQWRCFHCDEVFTERKAAYDHFGDGEACQEEHAACVDPLRSDEKQRITELREAQDYAFQQQERANAAEDRMEEMRSDIARLIPGADTVEDVAHKCEEMQGRVLVAEEQRDEARAQAERLRAALEEWSRLAEHLSLSTSSHRKRTLAALAETPAEALEAIRAEAVEQFKREKWKVEDGTSHHPTHCPVTGLSFFMTIESQYEPGRMVATYGGPFDSYTIPEWSQEDNEFTRERYDHDAGMWVDGCEVMGLVLLDESALIEREKDIQAEAGRQRAVRILRAKAGAVDAKTDELDFFRGVLPSTDLRELADKIEKEDPNA